jgi:hypothetical protein
MVKCFCCCTQTALAVREHENTGIGRLWSVVYPSMPGFCQRCAAEMLYNGGVRPACATGMNLHDGRDILMLDCTRCCLVQAEVLIKLTAFASYSNSYGDAENMRPNTRDSLQVAMYAAHTSSNALGPQRRLLLCCAHFPLLTSTTLAAHPHASPNKLE